MTSTPAAVSGRLARPTTIPALDTMRFLGVLAVMGTHVGFHAGIYTSTGVLGFLASRLSVGVAIFFVLSGFLLSREWLVRGRADQPAPSAREYYRKRFWRIYPAYLVVALVVLSATAENRARWPEGWISTLLMIDPYTTNGLPEGFTQTWSLSTEVAFYAVLPLLMWLLLGRSGTFSPARIVTVLAGCAVLTLAWLGFIGGRLSLDGAPVYEWLPAYLSWFAAGIGLAVLHTAPEVLPRTTRLVRSLAASPGVCGVLALVFLLISTTPVAGPWLLEPMTRDEEITRHLLFLAVGVFLIIPAAFNDSDESAWIRMLSHPVGRHVGHISYSVFLTHMAVIQVIAHVFDYPLFGGNFVPLFVLTLVVSILVSEVLYYAVERPFTRLGRRQRTAPTVTPSAATVR